MHRNLAAIVLMCQWASGGTALSGIIDYDMRIFMITTGQSLGFARGAGAKALLCVLVLVSAIGPASAQRPPDRDYLVYVVCESADKIVLVRFGPAGARIDHQLATGVMPTDIDGPHGLAFSPDKQFYYVSLGHGRPFGSAWKYQAGSDSVVGRVTLGLFPATMDVTPDGNFLFVVNFNLHGDMV